MIEKVEMDNDLMRSLSFDLVNKIRDSIIIFYSKESNNLNIICNVSKTLNDNIKIDAAKIPLYAQLSVALEEVKNTMLWICSFQK